MEKSSKEKFPGEDLNRHGGEINSELKTELTNSHEFRAVLYGDSSKPLLPPTRNQTSIRKVRRKKNDREKLEEGLARARAAIRASLTRNVVSLISNNPSDSNEQNDSGFVPSGAVYRNPGAFYQSYLEMERRFKVYVYDEGELPITHYGPCKHLYTSEGRFIHEIEHNGRFRTRSAQRAHVYFMPFSVTMMVKYLYNPLSKDATAIREIVADYVRVVSSKYPFWNRTQGADHFMLACHDWGPYASRANPFLFNTSIRVLCNANTSEGFNPQKDVTLPEIHLLTGDMPSKLLSPPPFNTSRTLLSFFAGGLHGDIRAFLLQYWQNRSDSDFKVHEYLPKGQDYFSFMLQSKFCLCPSGYEVASPRIVESIYADCVPVLLSQNYVLPFSDVLNWDEFSVQVDVAEIPRLKEILSAIPEEKYLRLKRGVRAVRRHFVLNKPSKRFDAFHMILHSIWLRRINEKLI
ncbi:Exostosin, GT47 domain [Dillenia turbinata]|uniref:Exostosin, GT47 domain n=1 Tax=Dillenia turbinata TaxID=194707 RepID=A0AAN8UBW8_9MAGN